MSSKNDPNTHLRAIDAPALPAWRSRPAPPPDEDEAETQSMLDRPPELDPRVLAADDPRELARKLALEAKMRMNASPPPIPQREPQEREEEPTMAAEDPRELARRLAEEAKRRLKEPEPPARPNSTPPPVDRPAAERASEASRPMTALEALAAAREAEKRRAQSSPPPAAPSMVSSPPTRTEPTRTEPMRTEPMRTEPIRTEPMRTEPAAVGPTTAPTGPLAGRMPAQRPSDNRLSLGGVASLVKGLFGDVEVDPPTVIENPEIFRALWRSHSTRALHDGDIQMVATASVLVDAAARLAPGALAATRVRIGPTWWALWIDLERGVLLGAARPAEIYLAGL